MSFQRVFSGAQWESKVGYCRALRAGDRIFVTGCAPVAIDGGVHAPGDPYAQTIRCIEIIREALEGLGGGRGLRRLAHGACWPRIASAGARAPLLA